MSVSRIDIVSAGSRQRLCCCFVALDSLFGYNWSLMTAPGRLNIIVFTDTFFEVNGIGSYYRMLLNWANRTNEVRVTIICPARDDLENIEASEHIIPVKGFLQRPNPFYKDLILGFFPVRKLKRIVAELPSPKVVHVATSASMGWCGAKVARDLKLPAVGYYHTDLQEYGRVYGERLFGRWGGRLCRYGAKLLDRFAYGSCQAMCVPSSTAEDTVNGFFQGPIKLIANPVDVQGYCPGPSRDGLFRKKYGQDDRVLIVAVGRVAKEKNLDLVCKLLGGDERIKLVFVGDGPYAATLRQQWGACVTGFLHKQELLDAYQQADIFVQLSTSETFGLSLVEALASGLPAFALRSQGFVSTIAPGCGVELLEESDLGQLADRCVALVNDRAEYETRSRKVRELVMRISTEVIFPELQSIHESFLPTDTIPTIPCGSKEAPSAN